MNKIFLKRLTTVLQVILGLIGCWCLLLGFVSTIFLITGFRFYRKDPNPPNKYIPVTEQMYKIAK